MQGPYNVKYINIAPCFDLAWPTSGNISTTKARKKVSPTNAESKYVHHFTPSRVNRPHRTLHTAEREESQLAVL